MGSSFYLRAGRKVKPAQAPLWRAAVVAALLGAGVPVHAVAAPSTAGVPAGIASTAGIEADLKASGMPREMREAYEARNFRPLWISNGGVGPEGRQLMALIDSAELDGLDPDDYRPRAIAKAIERAQDGTPESLAKLERLMSRSFTRYVRDVRTVRPAGIVYVDRELKPKVPTAGAVMMAAATAPSLRAYLDNMQWTSPLYAGLRKGLAQHLAGRSGEAAARDEQVIRLNLERARALPAYMGRYILVDAVGARLSLYDNGRVQDTMKVIVGKPDQQTPVLAAMMRYTVVNPYWNVPTDLVRDRIAPKALEHGPSYVRASRYELLSDWSDSPRVIAPEQVDWAAVAAGKQELRVRQLPGADNMMGKMKFMFPNELGVYLHDTPDKALFKDGARRFSSGCVRVEDARRLARWLYGKPLIVQSSAPEQQVPLPAPVPVYITYLTATPAKQGITFRDDAYGLDKLQPGTRKARTALAGL